MKQASMFHALKRKWAREREAGRIRSEEARHRLVHEGREVFEEFNIRKVILFGSVLENTMGAGSDIDIFVDPLPGERFFAFQCRLEDRLGLSVDVHTMADDATFIRKVLQRGEVIYEV